MGRVDLTSRQEIILRAVVEGHVQVGQPVGSKWLAEEKAMPWKPSTIRAELARLEELGLLQHPHTSAGRVPTDQGYRHYVDELLEGGTLPEPRQGVQLGDMRREIDEAMRVTTDQLSQMTDLLAVVSAPPIETTTIRHVEVLLLQPQVAMVVVITSTGGVTKRVISYDEPVDPGLVDWAGSYLSETLDGIKIGTRTIHARLTDESLGGTERAFLTTLAPAFMELEETAETSLYFGGAARLLQEERFQELSQINELMQLLERRKALLALVRHALDAPSVWLAIGEENERPELRSLSVVASGYGLATRRLGAVSVMGPVRMDYGKAITSVRQAAEELSRFVEDIYEE
jgi:heat-inducible transcriptional repressor